MKTKQLKNGDIKVWYDKEDDFVIVRKGEPPYDTLIDGNLLTKKYTRILVQSIKDAGLDAIHGMFLEIDGAFRTVLRTCQSEN
jgi:hypothetical protein